MSLPATPWHVLRERWLSVQHTAVDEHPLSPCMSICAMNHSTGECAGCLRTLDEIAMWGSWPASQQHRVWARLGQRLQAQAIKPE